MRLGRGWVLFVGLGFRILYSLGLDLIVIIVNSKQDAYNLLSVKSGGYVEMFARLGSSTQIS